MNVTYEDYNETWSGEGGNGSWWVNATEAPGGGSTTPCNNEYCLTDDDYMVMVQNYIYPSLNEWVFICLHCVVFAVGLVGNLVVALSVIRNPNMHTVTNYFIVNLALADFFVILICLPFTVLWDVTETWFFGSTMCKAILYIQTVSISVSVLTLTFISVDRWYAICYPLKFKSTTGRAKMTIFIIWFISLAVFIPDTIYLDTRANERFSAFLSVSERFSADIVYLTTCVATWDAHEQTIYQLCLLFLLYLLPLLLMSLAYAHIFRVLWRSSLQLSSDSKLPRCASSVKKSLRPSGCSSMSNVSVDGKIRSRRKAAKMLLAVVAMFGLCYFPVHLLNVLRYFIFIPQNELTNTFSLLAHWLCYANSAMNPVIYNIMSGKFRNEFKRTLFCGLQERLWGAGAGIGKGGRWQAGVGRRSTGGLSSRNMTTRVGGSVGAQEENRKSCRYAPPHSSSSTLVSHSVAINMAHLNSH